MRQVVNNAYDASQLFEKICQIYNVKLSRKQDQIITQSVLYGENSASAIIILQATSQDSGKIIHANNEVQTLLGYSVKEVIGKNVTSLMPVPIGRVHDKIIQSYFETAIPKMVDQINQQFCVHKTGYLKPMRTLVKVFPEISERILFIGFLQVLDFFEEMEPAKHEFDGKEQ